MAHSAIRLFEFGFGVYRVFETEPDAGGLLRIGSDFALRSASHGLVFRLVNFYIIWIYRFPIGS